MTMQDTEITAESPFPPDSSTMYVALGLGGYVTATSVLAGFGLPGLRRSSASFDCNGCILEDEES